MSCVRVNLYFREMPKCEWNISVQIGLHDFCLVCRVCRSWHVWTFLWFCSGASSDELFSGSTWEMCVLWMGLIITVSWDHFLYFYLIYNAKKRAMERVVWDVMKWGWEVGGSDVALSRKVWDLQSSLSSSNPQLLQKTSLSVILINETRAVWVLHRNCFHLWIKLNYHKVIGITRSWSCLNCFVNNKTKIREGSP